VSAGESMDVTADATASATAEQAAPPASAEPPDPASPPDRRRPSSQAVADVVITVLLLALFGWGFFEANRWSFQAALFPHIVTGAAFVLGVLHLVQVLLRLWRETNSAPAVVEPGDTGDAEDAADPDDVEQLFRTAGARRWASALGWVAAFFVLLYVTGLFITAPVFSLLYLRFAGNRTWIFSLIYAIVIGVMLYLAFELALGVPTPPGLFLD
jgi:Tripartite tricarboxylate transporter TctB family